MTTRHDATDATGQGRYGDRIIAVTGHRDFLDKGGDSPANKQRFQTLLQGLGAGRVLTGMALGFDQWAAFQAFVYGVAVTAVIPFTDQDAAWPEAQQRYYRELLDLLRRASGFEEVLVHDRAYAGPQDFQDRNEWMVDRAHSVVTYWRGAPSGTGNCIKYAHALGVPVIGL